MITGGCRFCNIKEMDNNKYITQRWQSFQFRFNSSAEIACNQPNFNRKIFVFNRILAEFLVYAVIRLIRISAEFFPNHPNFFRLQIGGLLLTLTDLLCGVLILTNLRGRGFLKWHWPCSTGRYIQGVLCTPWYLTTDKELSSVHRTAGRLFQMVMALTARWRCPAIVQARRGCRPDTMARGSRPVSRRISRQPPAEKKLRLSRRKKNPASRRRDSSRWRWLCYHHDGDAMYSN